MLLMIELLLFKNSKYKFTVIMIKMPLLKKVFICGYEDNCLCLVNPGHLKLLHVANLLTDREMEISNLLLLSRRI